MEEIINWVIEKGVQAFSPTEGFGRVTIPLLGGYLVGEAAKRLAKFNGINKPWIPWSASIVAGTALAFDLYNPEWILSRWLGSIMLGIAVPGIHHFIMSVLKSSDNEKAQKLAKFLAGETRNVDKSSIKISKEIDEKTGKEVYVVRAKDEETGQDLTVLRKNDATIMVDKTQPNPENKQE